MKGYVKLDIDNERLMDQTERGLDILVDHLGYHNCRTVDFFGQQLMHLG